MKIKDQLNRIIDIRRNPQRIISLVPSQTELLYYLGLRNEVVGITKFCVYPKEWYTTKTKVGGTKQYKLDVIDELHPDLIIANKEENNKEQIEILARKYPVWISDIKTLEDAFNMVLTIGELVNKKEVAQDLAKILKMRFSALNFTKKHRIAYFIWRKPYMIAANDTFINEMLKVAGYENIFEDFSRYPEISLEQLKENNPDVIFLSSEPYPFKEKHFDDFKKNCPGAIIKLVDGELFSWYGNRLLKSVDYFEKLKKEL